MSIADQVDTINELRDNAIMDVEDWLESTKNLPNQDDREAYADYLVDQIDVYYDGLIEELSNYNIDYNILVG